MALTIDKTFNVDLAKPINVRYGGGLVFTGDAGADTFTVDLYKNGSPYSPGGTVALNCIRADGNTVTVAGTVSGNVASATLTQACCAIPGPLTVVMQIVSGGNTGAVFAAAYSVMSAQTGSAIDPGTTITNISALIAAIDAAVDSIPADYSELLAAIAPNYSQTTYAVGDYVWHGGDLYRCNTAIASPGETWTAAHWTQVTVDGELSDLKSAIQQNDTDLKSALLATKNAIVSALENVVWVNQNGQTYIDDIVDAYMILEVVSISATISSSASISVLDDINDLKQYLTVTATMIDGTTETVNSNSYTLSGVLSPGESSITVSCYGKSATVTVTVTDIELPDGYTGYDYIRRTLNIGAYNDGSSSIITDFAMNPEYEFDTDVYIPTEATAANVTPLFGSRRNGYNPVNQISLWVKPSNGDISGYYHGTSFSGFQITKGAWHHVTIQPVGVDATYSGYATIKIDNAVYSTGSTTTTGTWSAWFTFFSIGSSATATYQGGSLPNNGLRIGRTKITDKDGVVLHYLIPVNNGTYYGLYDAVGETFYYNATYYENFVCENN